MEMGIVPPPRQPNPVLNDPQFKHAITPSSTDSTSLCSPSPTDGFILTIKPTTERMNATNICLLKEIE
ncbi:hypothetical protein QTN25_006153 [Entamoeba marina]